jgi:hypothetical protein
MSITLTEMSGVHKMQIVKKLPRVPIKLFQYFNVLVGQIFYINAAGFLQNFIGRWLMLRGKRSNAINAASNNCNGSKNAISEEGFMSFDHMVRVPKIERLAERFSRWCTLNSDKESQYRLQVSSKDYGSNFLQDFPEITTLIDEVVQSALLDYYCCDFEIINIHLYRTRKPVDIVGQDSGDAYGGTLCWHSDGSYTDTLKIFFLLSEVKDEDGPMLLMDRASSEKIFRNRIPFNFLNHGRPNLPEFQNWTSEFTGSPGKCLIVDTNRCLHRASVPNEKPRDMVTFYIGIKRNLDLDRFHDIKRTGEGLTGRF